MSNDIKNRIKNIPPYEPQPPPSSSPIENKPQEEPPKEPQEEQEELKTEEKQPQESQEAPKKEEEVKTEEETKPEEEQELPEGVSERTKKEFEKLKKHNQELKETIKKQIDVLSSLQPDVLAPPSPPNQFTPYFEPILTNTPPSQKEYSNLTQQEIDDIFNKLVDDQGYVDVNLLKEELRKQNERNRILEQKLRETEEIVKKTSKTVEDFQRTAYMRKIHQKYPQIDPESPQFDERMWEAVRNEIVGQWVTQGKEDVEAACEKWLNILYPNMGKDKQADKKAQINAVSPSSVSTSGSWEDHEALVVATRKGKKGALRERLKRAGY